MTDLFEAIHQRRSIRKYQSKPVPKELLEKVLDTAKWAPSAHNSQPWRFIILQDAKIKRLLAERMADAWAADMKKDGVTAEEEKRVARREQFASAPALILACLTMEGLRKFPDQQRQGFERDLAVESLGAGLGSLLLVAHGVGLGACWFCAPGFCKDVVRAVLKIPDTVEPTAFVLMGYPAEVPPAPQRKALGDYCFVDEWGKSLAKT